MAQYVKVLAVKPDELSFIPGTFMAEGKKNSQTCSLTSTCASPKVNDKHKNHFTH